MGCRSEHWTRENRAVPLLRQQMQFRSIGTRWPTILRQAQAQRRRVQVQAAMREKLRFRQKLTATKRKVRAWKRQARMLRKELLTLSDRYAADPNSVTPDDWDKATKREKGKLQYLLGATYPRDTWPAEIPYLNVIALRRWQEERGKERVIQGESRTKTLKKKRNIKRKVSQERAQTKETSLPDVSRAAISHAVRYETQMAERDAEIKRLEHYLAQWEKLRVLMQRCRGDPTSVSLMEWEDATMGTDILVQSEHIAQLVELARRREAGDTDMNEEWDSLTLAYRPKRKE